LLRLVPIERRRDLKISSRLGNEPIRGHRSLFASRSNTAWAGCARLGSWW
jgi:hypothetical protein